MKIKPVYLYSDSPSKALNVSEIIDNLSGLKIRSEYRGDFVESLGLNHSEQKELYHNISLTLIDDIEKEKLELGNISQNTNTNDKVLYDGFLYTRIINRYFLSDLGKTIEAIYIIFTDKLLCTFENSRYHARVILLGYPAFISTSGLVEAPARPREYYFLKAQFKAGGRDISELDEYFKGQYLEYDDPKTTDILTSYTLQVIFYELTGKPFCDNQKCCLFNSHWQKDVLQTQHKGKLCEQHQKILDNL